MLTNQCSPGRNCQRAHSQPFALMAVFPSLPQIAMLLCQYYEETVTPATETTMKNVHCCYPPQRTVADQEGPFLGIKPETRLDTSTQTNIVRRFLFITTSNYYLTISRMASKLMRSQILCLSVPCQQCSVSLVLFISFFQQMLCLSVSNRTLNIYFLIFIYCTHIL